MLQPKIWAKVESPNYNFSIDTLSEFFPGKNSKDLEAKYGKSELMNDLQGNQTLKFYVAHLRYKFPVLVQVKEGVVLDFFARLPSYFLHDIFLQSLVTRLGKQSSYKKVGEEAFYTWEANSMKHIYSAACTITCFPIFYSVHPTGMSKSLLDQMKTNGR